MPASKNLKCLMKQITKHRDFIAKERDALRELQSEIEDLREVTTRALDHLDDAIQAISEVV